MRFDLETTKFIKKYKDAKFYSGRIRWMLQDEHGTSVYCCNCGNIANCVLMEQVGRYKLNVPICKAHAKSLLEQ